MCTGAAMLTQLLHTHTRPANALPCQIGIASSSASHQSVHNIWQSSTMATSSWVICANWFNPNLSLRKDLSTDLHFNDIETCYNVGDKQRLPTNRPGYNHEMPEIRQTSQLICCPPGAFAIVSGLPELQDRIRRKKEKQWTRSVTQGYG